MNKFTVIILFSIFVIQQSYAENLNFETTAEGITNVLTKPKTEQTIKTRSLRESNDTKTRSLKIVGKEQGKIIEKTITLSENQPVQGVNLKIEFDFDSYSIRPESFSLLNELGKALTGKKLKGEPIIITGHTDSAGYDAYNLELSLNRGLAVKSYLISRFPIPRSLIKVVGYGEAMPLVPNNNEENKQINRRVEVKIATAP
ncbi:MAG: OmpA family protein [Desulfobacula sp.]|nr:OmpA family protein [Desulfobacula sp.]